jgi:hypothetical protein
MLPEEAIFQSVMLTIASVGFFQSTLPAMMASKTATTFRDARAYTRLFQRAGVSWLQYKSMLSVKAIEWMEVDPDTIVQSDENKNRGGNNDDNYMYWLYGGTVQVHSQGQVLQTVTRQSHNKMGGGLLGDLRFASELNDDDNEVDDFSTEEYPKTTLKAGLSGATLLRINTSKLKKLMKNDASLAKSIRRLIIKGIQDKLMAAASTASY